MPQIVCNIALDVSVNDVGQKLMAKQGDFGSRLLCVQFTDCKRPLPLEPGVTVLLNAAKGEEKNTFLGSVSDGGTALFVLPDFVLDEAGVVICDVSAVDKDGERLTTEKFEIVVEEDFLASQSVHKLIPEAEWQSYVLRPAVNRKYTVDLSDECYAPDGFWAPISLELPHPTDVSRENWVVLYCHAPVTEAQGGVILELGEDVLLSDGMLPLITMSDFEVICTYSPLTGCWRVGVVQYGRAASEE